MTINANAFTRQQARIWLANVKQLPEYRHLVEPFLHHKNYHIRNYAALKIQAIDSKVKVESAR